MRLHIFKVGYFSIRQYDVVCLLAADSDYGTSQDTAVSPMKWDQSVGVLQSLLRMHNMSIIVKQTICHNDIIPLLVISPTTMCYIYSETI